MVEETKPMTVDDQLVADAVNDTVKENKAPTENLEAFVRRVSEKFIMKKLDAFPKICDIFRMQNKLKMDEHRSAGNEGGWSPTRDFKWDFEVPSELYHFMVNLVYRNFWEEENEKVWRPFLKALMRGDDPMSCLMKVKSIYGSTKDAENAGIV